MKINNYNFKVYEININRTENQEDVLDIVNRFISHNFHSIELSPERDVFIFFNKYPNPVNGVKYFIEKINFVNKISLEFLLFNCNSIDHIGWIQVNNNDELESIKNELTTNSIYDFKE